MQPIGTGPINAAYFDALSETLDGCNGCAELQAQVNAVMADLQAYLDGIGIQIALIAPVLALLEVPTNPAQAVTWVQNFITSFLTPYVKPYEIYLTQIIELNNSVVTLIATINEVSARFTNCTITVPPLVPPVI